MRAALGGSNSLLICSRCAASDESASSEGLEAESEGRR